MKYYSSALTLFFIFAFCLFSPHRGLLLPATEYFKTTMKKCSWFYNKFLFVAFIFHEKIYIIISHCVFRKDEFILNFFFIVLVCILQTFFIRWLELQWTVGLTKQNFIRTFTFRFRGSLLRAVFLLWNDIDRLMKVATQKVINCTIIHWCRARNV